MSSMAYLVVASEHLMLTEDKYVKNGVCSLEHAVNAAVQMRTGDTGGLCQNRGLNPAFGTP